MKKLISIVLMLGLFLNIATVTTSAKERNSYTIIFSQEMIDAGYRMSFSADANCEQIKSEKGIVIGKKQYFDGETTKISGYPAVNNGKNFTPLLVDFSVNGEHISHPVYMASGDRYAPKPIDFGRMYADGTVIVVTFHHANVNYYDNDGTLLTQESVNAYSDAAGVAANDKEDETNDYKFTKWVNEDGSDAVFTNVVLDMNVYAVYTTTPKHSVSFIANEETVNSQYVSNGKNAQYDVEPTKEAKTWEDETSTYETTYTFAGWSVNGIIVDAAAYEINESTVFTAEFTETTIAALKPVVETPSEENTETEKEETNEKETEVEESETTLTPAPVTPENNETTIENKETATPENNLDGEVAVNESTNETTLTTPVTAAAQTIPVNNTTSNTADVVNNTAEVNEVIEDNETPMVKSLSNNTNDMTAKTATIKDEKTPLAKAESTNNNMMLLGGAALLGFFLIALIKRNKKEENA